MGEFARTLASALDGLGSVGWPALSLAVGCHSAKTAVRSCAWRAVLAAAHGGQALPFATVYAAHAAGAGTAAVVPFRAGDAVKLALARRALPDTSYATLGATLAVEPIFDGAVAAAFLVWMAGGVVPGGAVAVPLAALSGGAVALRLLRGRPVATRLRTGFAILGSPARYLRGVASWQAADWLLRLATLHFLLVAFGLPGDLRTVLLAQAAACAASAVPLGPARLPGRQALLIALLAPVAPAGSIVAFGLGTEIVLVTVNVAVGIAAGLAVVRGVARPGRLALTRAA